MTGLRILHVAQPTSAGVGEFVAGLAGWQKERGYDVHVASPVGGVVRSSCERHAVAWHAWPGHRGPGPLTIFDVARLSRVVRRVRPDVLHLHSSSAGLAGRLVARGRIATVFQPHAWSFLALEIGLVRTMALRWERWAQRWTALTIAVSEGEAATGRQAGIGKGIVVIPNGVPHPPHGFDGWTRGGPPRVVCLGRLSKQKGQDLLLRAWPSVKAAVPAAELFLVGDGPEASELRREAGPGVHFVGWSDEPYRWLASADVVVAPSRWEGLSLTVLQAMSLGRSVVATDVDGMRDALLGGAEAAGALVPREDPDALAVALVERCRNPDLAAREGSEGRRQWQDRFRQDVSFAAITVSSSALVQSPVANSNPLHG